MYSYEHMLQGGTRGRAVTRSEMHNGAWSGKEGLFRLTWVTHSAGLGCFPAPACMTMTRHAGGEGAAGGLRDGYTRRTLSRWSYGPESPILARKRETLAG